MTLLLNDQALPLHFTINALCTLEEMTGQSLAQLLLCSLSAVRGLLWCALVDSRPGFTLQEAGEQLEKHLQAGGSLSLVANRLAEALADAGFFHPGEKAGSPPSP